MIALPAGPPGRPSADAVREAIRGILARPEFGSSSGVSPLERVRDWLGQWLDQVLVYVVPAGLSNPVAMVIAIGGLVAIVVALVAILRLQPWRETRAAPAARLVATDVDPAALRARAAAAAREGRFRDALRLLYLSLLAELDRRAVLRYDGTRTNWEHVAAVRGRPFHAPMREITGLFDRAWYGGAATTAAEYDRALSLVTTIERSADAARG